METLYLKAKEAYYAGEPFMDDDEFDELEAQLKEIGSDVINIVGASDRRFKHKHLSPMCSLDKKQASVDGKPPIDEMRDWFAQFPPDTVYEATPKFDGMAGNVIYKSGKINIGISRGDKEKGKEFTEKLLRKVPLTISEMLDVEVRGEIVMPTDIFYKKYYMKPEITGTPYKNPRNMVAGVINRDSIPMNLLDEMAFIPVEVRIHDGDYDYPSDTMAWLKTQNFDQFSMPHSVKFKAHEFYRIYDMMKDYREKDSPYQLDGFVVKCPEHMRKSIGESGHHPKWAIAVKFPPKRAVTTVKSIRYQVGTTGEIVPTIILEPIELDGSTVRKTAGYNIGNIINNGLFPGAEVAIAKSGDIIPIIVKIVKPVYNGSIISTCPCGKGKAYIDGIHLRCGADECGVMMEKRFIDGIGVYRMDSWGGVTRKTIFESGYDEIWKVFDKSQFNEDALVKTGNFKYGKTLSKLFIEMNKIKSVTLPQVIVSLKFPGVGSTASRQLAKYIRGQKYNFFGLEKEALVGFDPGQKKREKIEKLVSILESRGIKVEQEPDTSNAIGFEMTGSPSASGFKVKSDFEKFMATHGYVHKGLKEAKYLLTDSLTSSSGKMNEARKKGVKIYEYSDFVQKLKDGKL